MVPGSRSLSSRCLFFLLEGIQTLYFPSFQFVRQNPNEAQGGGSFRCSSHSTLVANSTLVSTASPKLLLVQRPILLPHWDELLTLPQEDFLHPLKDVMRVAAWHVSGITYMSEESLQGQPTMCSSHGVQGQKKQYSAAWECFCCWCDRKQRNPLQADLGTVCDFPTEQYEDSKIS